MIESTKWEDTDCIFEIQGKVPGEYPWNRIIHNEQNRACLLKQLIGRREEHWVLPLHSEIDTSDLSCANDFKFMASIVTDSIQPQPFNSQVSPRSSTNNSSKESSQNVAPYQEEDYCQESDLQVVSATSKIHQNLKSNSTSCEG